MKKFLTILAIINLSSIACISHAELIISPATTNMPTEQNLVKPSQASVVQLAKVLQIDNMIDTFIAQQKQLREGMQNLPKPITGDKKSIFSKKTNEQLNHIFEKYTQIFGDNIDEKATKEQLLNAYYQSAQNHYNQDEVNALIAFYDTPMGQSILAKDSVIQQEFLQTVMPTMMGNMDKIQQNLPDLGKELEKIFRLSK